MQSKRRQMYRGIQPPQLPKTFAPQTSVGEQIADHASLTGCILTNDDFSEQAADDLLFEQVHLKRVMLARTELTTMQMHDVRCDVCDFAGATWENAHLNRIEWRGCRLVGFKLLESQVTDAVIAECNAEFALFWSSVFKAARFERCNLQSASFQDADLSGVVFNACDLSGADLRGAKLVGADLRGSTLDGLNVGIKELQGAIIAPTQAVQVASLLGIVIKGFEE
jgi:uncharacterized protein YjbI with pentapeptide repeats